MRNKKGQVMIFVILAVIIVAVIVLFFTIYRGPKISIGEEFNPENFIDRCLRESLREKTGIMLSQGGFVAPTDFKLYNDIKVSYLCKNINHYEPCINQYPRYITRLQQELDISVKEDVETCFVELESELDKRNYQHSGGEISVESVLKPRTVEMTVYRDFSLQKNEVSRNFDSFTVSVKSPLYDLALVANEIVGQEAKFCYFEYVGFNVLYPEFDIKKHSASDSTKIYTIKDKKTGAEMNIAVRGCAIPAGF